MHFKKEFLPYFLVIGIIFIIISSAFYFSFVGKPAQKLQPSPSVSPKPTIFSPRTQDIDSQNLQYHPDSSTKVQTIDDASQKMLDKDAAIGNLLSKLPYKGTFFSLEYSYQANAFTVNLPASNQAQANQEFDQFLKDNKIESRNWLYNLKTINQ